MTETTTPVLDAPTPVVAVTATDDPSAVLADADGSKSADAALVEADLLVEDVSIDGMCGVY